MFPHVSRFPLSQTLRAAAMFTELVHLEVLVTSSFNMLHSGTKERIVAAREFPNQGFYQLCSIREADIISQVYKTVNYRVLVVSLEVWTTSDPILVEANAGATLGRFTNYNKNELTTKKKGQHDNAQLVTKVDLEGTMVGLAQVGSMCSYGSSAISQDWHPNALVSAGTVAHEFGHNNGLYHYGSGCVCDPQKQPCIMSATAAHNPPNGLTDCSQTALYNRCGTGNCLCLLDMPETLYGPSKCGNAIVESGEECDCGTKTECKSSCCNPDTCKLLPHAQCDSGECCKDCKFAVHGAVCRPELGECDLEEHCTGTSHICPRNTYKQDGMSCNKNQGYCMEGKCSRSYDSQCQFLWGANGVDGHDICYSRLNVKGDVFGNCGTDSAGQPVKCALEHVKCGTLQCSGDNIPTFPVVGTGRSSRNYYFNSMLCRAGTTNLGKDIPDPTVVKHGSKCGDGKICVNKECVNVTVLTSSVPQCSEPCANGGVCNNKGHCHCPSGWACPRCVEPGKGGSIDSGMGCEAGAPSSGKSSSSGMYAGIGVGVAIIVIVIIVFVIILRKKMLNGKREFRNDSEKNVRPKASNNNYEVDNDNGNSKTVVTHTDPSHYYEEITTTEKSAPEPSAPVLDSAIYGNVPSSPTIVVSSQPILQPLKPIGGSDGNLMNLRKPVTLPPIETRKLSADALRV